MGTEVNLRKNKKRRKSRFGWMFFLPWLIPVIIVFITLISENDNYIDIQNIPGKIIGGSIAFDGRYYWATRILVSFDAEVKREIVQFDPSSDVYHVFTPEYDFRGLAYDGEHLWTADATGSQEYLSGDGNFYIIDQESGQFLTKFTIDRDYLLDGLTAGNGMLWVLGRYSEQQNRIFLWTIDQHIRSITHEVEMQKDLITPCSGIAFLDGYIWAVVGLAGREVVKISPHDGRIVQRYDFSESEINGITTDGKQIFIVDGEVHQLYALDIAEE
jgi:hypothetical protein